MSGAETNKEAITSKRSTDIAMQREEQMISAWKWNTTFLPQHGGAMYGWFFWAWMGVMILECLFLLPKAQKHSRKTRDRIVLVYGILMFVAEIYKQAFFAVKTGEYQWHLFPWQFCSVPMYVAAFAPLLKDGSVKDALYKFLSFFGLIAGIMTLILPEGLYWDHVTITCHSFFWHTSIVVIGLYLIAANQYTQRTENFIRELLPAAFVFTISLFIALSLNVIWWYLFSGRLKEGVAFNMFYISPFFTSSLPVFRDIQPVVIYPVFLFLYIFSFCIGAAILWFLVYGTQKLLRKR